MKLSRCIVGLGFFAVLTLWTGLAGAEPVAVRSRFDVSIYGYLRLDASYDTQRTAAGNLMFYVLPKTDGARSDEFNMTARETRLGLNIRAPEFEGIRTSGRLETDFYSGAVENAPNLRLRLAYVDVERGPWSLRAGQDWETLITVIPRIVNFSYLANAGALGLRRPQVRLTRTFSLNERMRLVTKIAAARTIGEDMDGGGQDDGAASGFPTGQANMILEVRTFGDQTMVIGLSGHAGQEKVSAYVDHTNPDAPVDIPEKDYDTWSVILSLGLPLTPHASLQGSIWRGSNLNNYWGGIGQGINRQQQTAIDAQGGWAQLVLTPTDAVNVNLGYGLDNPDAADLNPGQRERNELLFANISYACTPALTVAAEYSYLTTSYKDGADAVNNRIQTSLIYRF